MPIISLLFRTGLERQGGWVHPPAPPCPRREIGNNLTRQNTACMMEGSGVLALVATVSAFKTRLGGSVCKHEVGFLFRAVTCLAISQANLRVSGKLMLPRWAVRISLTGSYLPHLHTCPALASPSLSPLSLALSVRCPSLALSAVTQPVGWWRGAVNPQQRPSLPWEPCPLVCRRPQTVFPDLALTRSEAAQLILQ